MADIREGESDEVAAAGPVIPAPLSRYFAVVKTG